MVFNYISVHTERLAGSIEPTRNTRVLFMLVIWIIIFCEYDHTEYKKVPLVRTLNVDYSIAYDCVLCDNGFSDIKIIDNSALKK